MEKPDRPKLFLVSPKIVYLGIKYFNNKSVKFAQRLAKIISKYNETIKVVPNYKTRRKQISYFSAKAKNHFQNTSVGVYKLPCKDCDLSYIGATGKSLKIRMKQHESSCRNHSNFSAVVNHHELGHSIDFANSCVIYPVSHMTKRKIAESLLIGKQKQHVMDGNINSFRLIVFRE